MPLPAGLPSITFGGELTQSMGEVTLLAGRQSPTFGGDFTKNGNVTSLAGLRYLTLALFSTKHGNM